jgi:hypothetical protein
MDDDTVVPLRDGRRLAYRDCSARVNEAPDALAANVAAHFRRWRQH